MNGSAKRIPVAVIGCGHLGTFHARLYTAHPDASLVAVVDVLEDRARALAQETGARAASDISEIEEPVRAVSIATPTSTHMDVALACLDRGCHLLVEKPITATEEEARRMIAAAQARGLVVAVGHTERFNPSFREAAAAIRRPRFIEAHRLAPFVPRSLDVDVVLDLMIHDLDLVLAMVAGPPVQVDASGVGVLTPREDIANARLLFPDGTVANLTASRISREKMRKIRIFGDGQYVSIDLLARRFQRAWLVDGSPDPLERIRWEAREAADANPLADEIDDFLKSVSGAGPPRVPAAEGLAVLRLALEVRRRVRDSLISTGSAPGEGPCAS